MKTAHRAMLAAVLGVACACRTSSGAATGSGGDASWYEALKRSGSPVHVGEVPPADGFWMSNPDETPPSAEEHKAFADGMSERLGAFLRAQGVERGAYVRGDFFGAREEQIYAYGERFATRPQALAGAVRIVQAWVREHPRWRVIVPLDDGPNAAVAIYAGRIFFGPKELDDAALDQVMQRYVQDELQKSVAPR